MAQIATRLVIVLLVSVSLSLAHGTFVTQLSASGYVGFAKLLSQAGLEREIDAMIAKGDTVTVLAPTDAGITKHVSAVGLAALMLAVNRAALRQLLLHHFVPHRVSLFSWNGAATSATGSAISLSMDSSFFYAGNVPVQEINALATKNVVVHSMDGLIVPAPLASAMRPLRPYVTPAATTPSTGAGATSPQQPRKMAAEKPAVATAAGAKVQPEDDVAIFAAAAAAAAATEAETKVSNAVDTMERRETTGATGAAAEATQESNAASAVGGDDSIAAEKASA